MQLFLGAKDSALGAKDLLLEAKGLSLVCSKEGGEITNFLVSSFGAPSLIPGLGYVKNRDLHRNRDKRDYKSPVTKVRIANPDQPGAVTRGRREALPIIFPV